VKQFSRLAGLAGLTLLAACHSDTAEPVDRSAVAPDIVATNAFYYYVDVDAAWEFYRDVLGFETVIDYGFAKIMRVADTSYVTLVSAESGMHSADEPKTVTLNLVTDELDAWHQHFLDAGVAVKADDDDRPALSFSVFDTDGYALRFERFNPHAASDAYVDEIAKLDPLASNAGDFSVRAAVYTIYLSDFTNTKSFYDGLFARVPVATRDNNVLYQMAGSGFLSLVDGGDEIHQPTKDNGVTISFFTPDVDAWFERAATWPGFELRTPEIFNESNLVRVFVGYDPEGIFLEWDTFLDLEENRGLNWYLSASMDER
jgi:uncharacterized glyoxalase superfamily protein PhnB